MSDQHPGAATAAPSTARPRNQIALVVGAGIVIVLLAAVLWLWPRNEAVAATAEQVQQLAALAQQADDATRAQEALRLRLADPTTDSQSLRADFERRTAELAAIQTKIAQAGALLSDVVTAKAGDTHDRLVMDYLRSKHVGAAEASRLASKIALADDLQPGNRVWFLYRNGAFGTWVTQGDAPTAPRASAAPLAPTLVKEREASADALRTSRAELDAMTAVAERATRDATTVRYAVGSKARLTKDRIIDGSLRLQPEPRGDALVLDRPITLPALDPSAFGLRRIRKVTIVPGTVKAGRDFGVELVGGFARITILRPEQFLGFARFFVVVLE